MPRTPNRDPTSCEPCANFAAHEKKCQRLTIGPAGDLQTLIHSQVEVIGAEASLTDYDPRQVPPEMLPPNAICRLFRSLTRV